MPCSRVTSHVLVGKANPANLCSFDGSYRVFCFSAESAPILDRLRHDLSVGFVAGRLDRYERLFPDSFWEQIPKKW